MEEGGEGMLGRFGRRRAKRSRATEGAIIALENVRKRFGRPRTGRGGRAYGDAVGLGIGVLAMILTVSLLFWLVRRTTGETGPATPAPEEGIVEDTPLEMEAVSSGPPRVEDISPREEPPPGE